MVGRWCTGRSVRAAGIRWQQGSGAEHIRWFDHQPAAVAQVQRWCWWHHGGGKREGVNGRNHTGLQAGQIS